MNANAEIIRPDSKEKLIMSVTLYQGGDTLFYDSARTKPVTQEEAIDLFNKGLMLVAVEDGFKRPTGITIEENGAYTIAFGEGGYGDGSILCYPGYYDGSWYLFKDEDHTIPVTSGKDLAWYNRLLMHAPNEFAYPPKGLYVIAPTQKHYIVFNESTCYLDYNG